MSGAAEIPGLTNIADVVQAAIHRAADDDDRAEEEAKSGANTVPKTTPDVAKREQVESEVEASGNASTPPKRQNSQPKLIIPNGSPDTQTSAPQSQKQTSGILSDYDSASLKLKRSPQTTSSSPTTSSTRIQLHTPMVDSPSARTGPPRSFSYSFTRGRAPPSRRASDGGGADTIEEREEDTPDAPGTDHESEGEGYGDGYDYETARLDEIAESTSSSSSSNSSAAQAASRPRAPRTRTEFRGALEYMDPEQRVKEREARERRERNRLSRLNEGVSINPLRWLSGTGDSGPTQESPKEETGEGWTSYFEGLFKGNEKGKEKETTGQVDGETHVADGDAEKPPPSQGQEEEKREKEDLKVSKTSLAERPAERSQSHQQDNTSTPILQKRKNLARAQSMPHMKRQASRKNSQNAPRWARLRTLLPLIAQRGQVAADGGAGQMAAVQSHIVPITDELIFSGLDALMLRLWFERDEGGNRRVPVLLNQLRLRITDSVHPLSGNKAVFRIECEYSRARWVVYRQLNDFIKLHTHYRLSNAFNRGSDVLPDFPRTSLPYFRFLKKEGKEDGHDVSRADFVVMQRESLENYLRGLIRAVMFHPTANRLSFFLEISALSVQLAQAGGWQAKAGMLTVEAASKRSGGFGRKNASWTSRKKQRWCAVRESYLVAVEEPAELVIWDVFLLDSDFKIERPKRVYRQGINILQHKKYETETTPQQHSEKNVSEEHRLDKVHSKGTLRRVKNKVERALHIRSNRHGRSNSTTVASIDRVRARIRRQNSRTMSDSSDETDSESPTGESESEPESEAQDPPRVDPSTNTDPLQNGNANAEKSANGNVADPEALAAQESSKRRGKRRKNKDVSKHTFFVSNSQMRLKLFAKNERQMQQWILALERVASNSHWTGSNRFDSFAPIRLNVAAQWLVDGRDYMWNLSRAILLARERIYIHDWWLSPELQMRRPNKGRYRLDKLLERKAKEGVKIYVILYQEVSNRTTPTDSSYSKQRLTALHPNILVQRSPSHFQTGTFYWAHHEKLCVIDEAIAFMGGIDLCFGRWDTPQHVLIDDPDDGDDSQIWPGKDYSNARVSDFYTLNKPMEDMYDRQKVPRMPWHDVGMHIVGQPARDLCRHFVQRWNYLLRIKNHSRTMPFLIPAPDFKARELNDQGLTGTCEIQICRSCGPWSMGTPTRVEHSIQNAYLKSIQMSEHFVYIENQFFITSTVVNDVVIENQIGNALVARIIRAHREKTKWRACIVIPLLPGFPCPVDHSDASSVRIILECQNRTICRGPNSIFSKLRKEGIDPDEYISVFSLRNWGKLPGNVLTTEMVYIHGKVCIVDDRLAIIGSANINERSQRGDRDSELAAIVRDTDMIDGTMAGKPYKVGRFAHTLRVRLMREHIGVDVDAMYQEDLMESEPVKDTTELEPWDPDHQQHQGIKDGVTQAGKSKEHTAPGEAIAEIKDSLDQALHGSENDAAKKIGQHARKMGFKGIHKDALADDNQLAAERQNFNKGGEEIPGFASAVVPTLEEKTILEHSSPTEKANGSRIMPGSNDKSQNGSPPQARVNDGSRELYAAPADASKDPQDDSEVPHARGGKVDPSTEEKEAVDARKTIRKHLAAPIGSHPWTLPTPAPSVDPHGFDDPVCDEFWKNVWVACAVHNTEIFRKVFHCVPDDTVTTWKQYKEFILHHERLNKPIKDDSGPTPAGRVPSEAGDEDALGHGESAPELRLSESQKQHTVQSSASVSTHGTSHGSHTSLKAEDMKRQPSKAHEPFERWERDEMERLLGDLRGHLVLYPTRFLEGEDVSNNFLFNADRLLPMPIYD